MPQRLTGENPNTDMGPAISNTNVINNVVIHIVNDEKVINGNVKPVVYNEHAARLFHICHDEIE